MYNSELDYDLRLDRLFIYNKTTGALVGEWIFNKIIPTLEFPDGWRMQNFIDWLVKTVLGHYQIKHHLA